jgi:hypothetical protein
VDVIFVHPESPALILKWGLDGERREPLMWLWSRTMPPPRTLSHLGHPHQKREGPRAIRLGEHVVGRLNDVPQVYSAGSGTATIVAVATAGASHLGS